MSLIIYTDPHLGVNRANNTTARSRELLKEAVKQQVYDILGDTPENSYSLCLGDLFDTYSNKEEVIKQGQSILYYTDLVLAGNHDVVADADKVGSLQLLQSSNQSKFMYAPFGESYAGAVQLDEVMVVGVPHVTTQALFEESLSEAIDLAEQHKESGLPIILALHCNFNLQRELSETSLNLTAEHAEELLEVFEYVFCGHEHVPRDLYDGRLVILGNTHPTGFSDISDKRIAILDNVGGKLQVNFETIWRKSDGYLEVDSEKIPEETEAQFVRITGEIESDKLGGMARSISKLWKNNPGLLAVKSEVAVKSVENTAENGEVVTAESLPAIISKELEANPKMFSLWNEFLSRWESEHGHGKGG
jgi:DNA repair exonuclease SbcCD nuclease subunit